MTEFVVLHVFEELMEATAPEEAVHFTFAHPVVLSSEWQGRFESFAKSLPTAKRAQAAQVLESLTQMQHALNEDMSKYPLGAGPLDKIYKLIRNGNLAEAEGLALARKADTYKLLGLMYVRIISIQAERIAQANTWKDGLLLGRLILTALDARASELDVDQVAMNLCATIHWLDIVTRSVWDVPDGGLFRDAIRRGEALADTQDQEGFYAPGEILFRLGVLHLDPYVSGRTNINYERQWGQWQERLDQTWAADYKGSPTDSDRIPSVGKALPKAVDYLRRAVALRQGTPRGTALKALLQAMVWQQVSGSPADSSEIRRVASEAQSLLIGDRYASQRAEIQNLLAWHARDSHISYAKKVDPSEARRILQKPVTEWLKQKAPVDVINLFSHTASTVRDTEPRLAMNLWLAVLPLIEAVDDQIKETFFQHGTELVRKALVPPEALKVKGRTIIKRTEAARRLATQKGWDDDTWVAVLFSLALDTTNSNEEANGLELLKRVMEATTPLATRLAPLLLWWKASLQVGVAVNALNRGETVEAAMWYMHSVSTFLEAHQPRTAMDLIKWTLDLGLNRDSNALTPFIAGVAEVALHLEDEFGDSAMVEFQYYYRRVLARLLQQKAKTIAVLFLLLAAKGNRFARAIGRRGNLSWLQTREAQDLLRRIRELEPDARTTAATPSKLDEELLLTSYVSSREAKGGLQIPEQLRNLQIRFDTELHRQMVARQESAPAWIPTIESLQEAIGPRTVLLNLYVGANPKTGGFALFTLVLTRENVKLIVGASNELPSATIVIGDDDESVASNWLGLSIKAVREAVQQESGPRSASGDALDALTREAGQYFGGELPGLFATLRQAGKDHVCIAPHGPLHFYPFHLLGPEDEPLLSSWTVTYLPNLRLLDPSRKVSNASIDNKRELTAIGLNFDASNPRRLPSLAGAEEEASIIAKTFGIQPLTGPAATKAAVLEAFANSRRVHLASHGEHRVTAPAFQCVYLSGGPGEDVLYSYELLQLDLRGVDLVTLSACETALGRFDVSDNPRGFPASLFIAGVTTIVGTLWPTETNTAAFFFEALYGELRQGSSKGHAFYAAQSKTRSHFPQYRDWGAFHLAGEW